jgi:integrase
LSVYKHKRSPFYQFDFQVSGRRFCGSTGCASRKDAEKFEAVEREKAKAHVKAAKRAAGSLAIDDLAWRFWEAKGQHDSGADATAKNVARLNDYFGRTTPLTDIDDAAVSKLVSWRRGHRVKDRDNAPLISNATVNRSSTKILQRLFAFAKSEGVQFDREPDWSKHLLKEPPERVRELQDHEADAFDVAMRDDYASFFEFVRTTGLRLNECVTLRWSEVNFDTNQIVRLGKGGRRVTFPIVATIRQILYPLRGQHPEFVFTYVALVTSKRLGRVRGQRYPLTYTGTKTAWQRLRVKAGVADFRFHDYRHDFGTKLLRKTGNLKLVQRALNHADIRSTLRYAHVLDQDIAAAVEDVAKSRTKPRGRLREVG